MGKGLVILHLDGVGHDVLRQAIDRGDLPSVARLIDDEGYEPLEYRCGIPSTTPFCQAGILYGDNREIPGYRWWDKEAGMLVRFGRGATFKEVEDSYFRGSRPLTQDGAVIGACYAGGAKDTFGLAYRNRHLRGTEESRSALRVLLPFFGSAPRVGDWLRHAGWAIGRTVAVTVRERARGRPAAAAYVASDMLEEIFLHHVARYAVKQAMDRDFQTIYAGFYAYDETAHAFGPDNDYCYEMLGHVDRTIADIAARRRGRQGTPSEYELVILSDHGQVETEPFGLADGRGLGDLLAARLPGQQVLVAPSGGLAHVYLTSVTRRLAAGELDRLAPGLADGLASLNRVAFVLLRDEDGHGLIVTSGGRHRLGTPGAAEVLVGFDDPGLLTRQLERLNSYERSGDVVVFGAFRRGRQVNFEHQVGGHGSIGGEQVRPFLLVKREWGIDTGGVENAADLHPILSDLRDRLAAAG